MPIATFYSGSPGPLADGTSYHQRGDFCAAPRHIPLGSQLLVRNLSNGRRLVVTVRDRGNFGRNVIDLPSRSFSRLAGRGWREKGIVKIAYHVMRKPKKRSRA